jgi:hypothetical protein
MCEEFSKTFLQISSACIPSKTILIREKDKPWFSNEIRKEIRIRDRLRKQLLKSQNDVAMSENRILRFLPFRPFRVSHSMKCQNMMGRPFVFEMWACNILSQN